jgi:hypothetical protein
VQSPQVKPPQVTLIGTGTTQVELGPGDPAPVGQLLSWANYCPPAPALLTQC